jgi:hypothetical protein
MRRNRFAAYLHYSICKALNIETIQKWNACAHAHTHKPVCDHEDVTVLFNQEVHTDRAVVAHWSDITTTREQ